MSDSHVRLFTPDDSEPESLTTRQAFDLYLTEKTFHCQSGAFSPKSLERAKYYLASFANFAVGGKTIGSRPAGVGRNSDLTAWLVANPRWRGTATKSAAVSQVVTAFGWLESEGYCDNPYQRPRFVGSPSRPRPAITPLEFRRLMRAARNSYTRRGKIQRSSVPFRSALLFLWKSGCRTSEMRAARWDQLDWERGVIELDRHKTADKTGEARQIPVRRLFPLLRWLESHRGKSENIFTNSAGKPWGCGPFARQFRRFAELAGVRKTVSAYCLRHGLTVRLIEAGCSDRAIADVLGHTSTQYVSWYGRATRVAANHLNDVLRKDRPPPEKGTR